MVQIRAVFAEYEARKAGERTSTALRAKKARGEHVGAKDVATFHAMGLAARRVYTAGRLAEVRPHIEDIRRTGVSSCRGIARELERCQVRTPRRGRWHPETRPSRTWGVLCPGPGDLGRGRDAVADGTGGRRGRRHAAGARGRRRRALAGRAQRGDAGPASAWRRARRSRQRCSAISSRHRWRSTAAAGAGVTDAGPGAR